tara:strand:+ start:264 stop:851 length:588 start_codon:yes stop_codon:yes gene_type:complete
LIKTIVIDPPYQTCTGGSASLSPSKHYKTQPIKSIIKQCKGWLSDYEVSYESHLYVWGLNSFASGRSKGIIDTLKIVSELGFRPITQIVWIKNNSNPTPFGQRQTEICIFAARWRKGQHKKVMYKGTNDSYSVAKTTMSKSVDFIMDKRREHSRKPNSFYQMVERRSNGKYLEMYGRQKRKDWIVLGDQTDFFEK